MLLHVIILVPKRKEKKKIYIYISPNAKPLHNNRFLSSRILSCITWFQHAWCAIRSFLPFTIYIHFSPHVKFQSHEFLYSPSICSRSIINRSSSEIFSLHPSLRWDANKKETQEREKCIDLKKTNGIDLVVSRDYARAITRKKTNQSIAIRSIKRNHHPGWWTIRLKRKVKEVIYLCSLDGLFYLYILDFCARGQQSLNDYYYYYYVFNFSFSFSFCAPLYIHQSSSQRPTVP